jgi:hypothetical protein
MLPAKKPGMLSWAGIKKGNRDRFCTPIFKKFNNFQGNPGLHGSAAYGIGVRGLAKPELEWARKSVRFGSLGRRYSALSRDTIGIGLHIH